MKLVQLNIWQGRLLKKVIEFLQAEDPDIVCLQEVFSCDSEIAVLDFLSSLEKIQASLQLPYVFYAPTFSFNTMGASVSFGNAILSKFPINNKEVLFTNNDYHVVEDWVKGHPPNTRNAQISTLQFGEKSFTIVNHHGYHEISPLGSEATVKAMQILTDKLHVFSGPVILAGDLNITHESNAMRLFDNWLEDLTEKHHINDTLTRFGKVTGVACDHILISPEIVERKFIVSEELVSDHKALILEFDI